MEHLNIHKTNILGYLFNPKEIELFETGKNIRLNKKWNIILNYPAELHSLKMSTTSRNILITILTELLLTNYKPGFLYK